PGSRETGASSGGRNPAEQHPIPIHPLGAPWPPRSIQRKMLIAISESRRPRRNSARYPVNAGSILKANRQGWYEFAEAVVGGYVRLRAEHRGIELGSDHPLDGRSAALHRRPIDNVYRSRD